MPRLQRRQAFSRGSIHYRSPVVKQAMRVLPDQAPDKDTTLRAGQFLTPIRSAGDECAQEGAIASGASGVLFCSQGIFQEVLPLGAPGDVCRAPGTIAKDKTTLEALFCKNGVLIRLSNVLAKSVTQSTVRVTDGMRLVKPACDAGGVASFAVATSSDHPLVYERTVRSTATASGNAWVFHVRDSSGTDGAGQGGVEKPSDVLEIACVY